MLQLHPEEFSDEEVLQVMEKVRTSEGSKEVINVLKSQGLLDTEWSSLSDEHIASLLSNFTEVTRAARSGWRPLLAPTHMHTHAALRGTGTSSVLRGTGMSSVLRGTGMSHMHAHPRLCAKSPPPYTDPTTPLDELPRASVPPLKSAVRARLCLTQVLSLAQ